MERISFLKNEVEKYERGICTERALLWTEYFRDRKNRRKPMAVQISGALRHVLDPSVLQETKQYPERHPNLLVRVSGYSAYFGDLSPELQDELIARTMNRAC